MHPRADVVDVPLREAEPLDDVPGRVVARAHPEDEAVVLDPLLAAPERLVRVRVLGNREQVRGDQAA